MSTMLFQDLYQKTRDVAEAMGQRLYCLNQIVTPFLGGAVGGVDKAIEDARLKIEPVIERYAVKAFVGAVTVVERGAEKLERFLEKPDSR